MVRKVKLGRDVFAYLGPADREVCCETCRFFGDGECGLYRILNDHMGEYFDLDVNVHKQGCCNAQQPEGD